VYFYLWRREEKTLDTSVTSINTLRSSTACLTRALFKGPFPDSPKAVGASTKTWSKTMCLPSHKAASRITSWSHRRQNIKIQLSNWLEMWTDPLFSRYWVFILWLYLYHSEWFGYKNSNKSQWRSPGLIYQ